MTIKRAYAHVVRAESTGPIKFLASTSDVARDGLIVEASGWMLDAFKRNPVFLWSHDLKGERLPIGKVTSVGVEKGNLLADVIFDQEDEFARQVESKYRRGFLNAVSVSWNTHETAPAKNGAPRIVKAELLEISGVNVPSDPSALALARGAYANAITPIRIPKNLTPAEEQEMVRLLGGVLAELKLMDLKRDINRIVRECIRDWNPR
jgi:hypothetical protein